ncbi:hypothetical protein ACFLS0_03990 [Candidatus Bipolaricaulota bacterium]
MNVAFLSEQADHILRQRIIEADEARMAKRLQSLRRSKSRLRRATIAGLRSGLAIDAVIHEVTDICAWRGLATGE